MPPQIVLRPFYSPLLHLRTSTRPRSFQAHLHAQFRPPISAIPAVPLPRILARTSRTASTMAKSTTPSQPDNFPTHSFPDASSFESFLETHHATLTGLYLKLAKKTSGIPSISAAEAVEVALCFGWIDGRANSLDGNFWTVRYTPRRAKSMWSAKNVGTIARLIEEGKMRPAGMAVVESAKADGRWERAYDGPASIEVPADLDETLREDGNEKAREFLEGLNRSDRYSVLHRLQTAPVRNRQERVRAVVEMLARGEVKNGARKPSAKVKVKTVSTTTRKVGKEAKGTEKVVVNSKVRKTKSKPVESGATTSTRQLRSHKPSVEAPF
ncbi:hypothetical protein BJY01DRAFT_218071 [Aspergillus pseudoustus]|uniref:Bacteriocin-protection, YdeI or OmpD-associated-domain-containing protein n=1 Tax=Aspergillus pseudoustus TaxID=1810923 RepID=A0ABR4JP54_9EURO